MIGLPGDTVEVRGGMLVINGRPIPRSEQAAPSQCPFPRTVLAGSSPGRNAHDQGRRRRQPACLYPVLSRDASRRPLLPVIDQVDNPRATISAESFPRGTCS